MESNAPSPPRIIITCAQAAAQLGGQLDECIGCMPFQGARYTTMTLTAALGPIKRIWMGAPRPASPPDSLFMADVLQQACAHPLAGSVGLGIRRTCGSFGNHGVLSGCGIPCIKFFVNGKLVFVGVKDFAEASKTIAVLCGILGDVLGAAVALRDLSPCMVNCGFSAGAVSRHAIREAAERVGLSASWNGGYAGVVLRPAGGGSVMMLESGWTMLSGRTPGRVLELGAFLRSFLDAHDVAAAQ